MGALGDQEAAGAVDLLDRWPAGGTAVSRRVDAGAHLRDVAVDDQDVHGLTGLVAVDQRDEAHVTQQQIAHAQTLTDLARRPIVEAGVETEADVAARPAHRSCVPVGADAHR